MLIPYMLIASCGYKWTSVHDMQDEGLHLKTNKILWFRKATSIIPFRDRLA